MGFANYCQAKLTIVQEELSRAHEKGFKQSVMESDALEVLEAISTASSLDPNICIILRTSDLDSGIYDIDYRGPETHSYLPPPNLYGRKHGFHQERSMKHRRSKGLRAGHAGKLLLAELQMTLGP
ncbi:hypothetical protein RJ640_007216 [Escallonia rubra]|uniref:Uncharacterized protein n=1 Tax=Escallonia rubra TaxID=112253 RepID=A0AA88UB01_9ASTE|nr:hypothetical protein RJ640_007216 [Escallonia rubra]